MAQLNSRALWLAIALVPAVFAVRIDLPGDALVAHEWGTFTSVADENGDSVSWFPLAGKSDLPCFVYRLGGRNIKLAPGVVRMETPVLYFYAAKPVTLSVHVDFPQGVVTEWYPQAARPRTGSIEWSPVEVRPGESPVLPIEKSASHYYAARETDSAPIRVGQQQEKLIFYRGMGDFSVPVRARMTSTGKMEIRNGGSEPIALAIVYENRRGKVGYRVARGVQDVVTLDLPELAGNVDRLRQEMEVDLTAAGLYPKEVHAMVETWRDSWFEEGSRVFLCRSAIHGGCGSTTNHYSRATTNRARFCRTRRGAFARSRARYCDRISHRRCRGPGKVRAFLESVLEPDHGQAGGISQGAARQRIPASGFYPAAEGTELAGLRAVRTPVMRATASIRFS